MPKQTTHLRHRIETDLLQKLEKAAESSGRTLTGEINERLKESFKREDAKKLVIATVESTVGEVTGIYLKEISKILQDKGGKS